MKKICTKCGATKTETDFYWRSPRSKGRNAHCKVCHNQNAKCWAKQNPQKRAIIDHRAKENRKKRDLTGYRRSQRNTKLKLYFGITIEQYDAMVVAQGGLCAICGRPEMGTQKGRLLPLSVDHNHATGKIRALLCTDCNRVLGMMQDNPQRLRKAVAYLEYHNE